MSKLQLPSFEIGMAVITPSSKVPNLTEDRKYTIKDIENDWLQIEDDACNTRYYRSHLFIEADIYYNMILFLALTRLFGIDLIN